MKNKENKNAMQRREFIAALTLAGASFAVAKPGFSIASVTDEKPAILGGRKAYRASYQSWPIYDKTEESALLNVLHSKKWGRLNGSAVAEFEKGYSQLLGVKHCLGVSSGTSALTTIMGAMDIGPGDEVVLPVYTFIASYNVVVLNYALPVFVDTDIESFQIDADKIESAVTEQTKIIMPVHIGGSPVDLDKVIAIGKKTNIPIIEDACQAHLGEWKGRKLGGFGVAGTFSFQSSKNLNSGEGGAVVTNDEVFAQSCYNFHNQGQSGSGISYMPGVGTRGTNLRLTEFQGNLLVAQMTRVVAQTERRNENANYLTRLLNEIPGISPAKLYKGTTKSAYHLYMFRYDKNHFDGLSRDKFIQAMNAEGVPCSPGYGAMNRDKYVTGLAQNKHYLKIYGEKTMKEWLERNHCPQNDLLTGEQAVWFTQNMLLGPRSDMEQFAASIKKIKKYAKQIINS